MVTPKRADKSSTVRQDRYLEGLQERKGKRLPVDFDGAEVEMLQDLKAGGYASTQGGVARRALREAYERQQASPSARKKR